jgi:hypothetical protein
MCQLFFLGQGFSQSHLATPTYSSTQLLYTHLFSFCFIAFEIPIVVESEKSSLFSNHSLRLEQISQLFISHLLRQTNDDTTAQHG